MLWNEPEGLKAYEVLPLEEGWSSGWYLPVLLRLVRKPPPATRGGKPYFIIERKTPEQ